MSFLKMLLKPIGIAFVVFLSFILWIVYEANTGATNVFLYFINLVPLGDKVGHVWLFGALAFLLNLALDLKTIRIAHWNMQLGSLLVLAFAVVEELSQGFFATRSLDALDILADILGVYIAAYLLQQKDEQ